ncbi:unnamed protein product [Arabis nemorensis]|uniref:Uncharacterized protein n=1 Tax=Arabis nemorensis TaxID=586526 RepID=A0A565CML8_9BRAS|nr:unnamed protein product [Arabis nemorensis]
MEDFSRDEMNRIVLSHIPRKKGRKFGVGRLPDLDKTSSSFPSYASPHLQSEIDRLNERLNEEREERERERAEQERKDKENEVQ